MSKSFFSILISLQQPCAQNIIGALYYIIYLSISTIIIVVDSFGGYEYEHINAFYINSYIYT